MGQIRFFGLRCGVAGVLFVCLALGALHPDIALPEVVPSGVLGVLLCFQFTRRWWKVTAPPVEEAPEILVRNYAVRNPGVLGRTIAEVLRVHKEYGFVVSRIQKGGQTDVATSATRLEAGDIVVIVGDEEAHERAQQIFGETSVAPPRPTSPPSRLAWCSACTPPSTRRQPSRKSSWRNCSPELWDN